jgi:23S rRNA (cytosine1962-C5)-methyltransferase
MSSKIFLKKGKEFPLRKFHPWVFSGAIEDTPIDLSLGEVIEIYSFDKQFLGLGYWNGGGIAVKILSFHKCEIDLGFWQEKIYLAKIFREKLGLGVNGGTNAFRLFNAEADGVPGLIIDKYATNIVIQLQSLALASYQNDILESVRQNYPDAACLILNSSLNTEIVWGSPNTAEILENGLKFKVDLLNGQKTGFFIDQRDNRLLAGKYSKDCAVLNAFSYSGGFSISALKGGAQNVTSVDSSKDAMELLAENLKINSVNERHTSLTADVFEYLNQTPEKFDLIISDPPAFCKHRDAIENAVKAYIGLNQQVMLKLNPGGLLFTFSCSQLISRDRFREAVMLAASRAGKHFRIAAELHAAVCHPAGLAHPEGEYLKGLLLVEAG